MSELDLLLDRGSLPWNPASLTRFRRPDGPQMRALRTVVDPWLPWLIMTAPIGPVALPVLYTPLVLLLFITLRTRSIPEGGRYLLGISAFFGGSTSTWDSSAMASSVVLLFWGKGSALTLALSITLRSTRRLVDVVVSVPSFTPAGVVYC